MNAVNTVSSTSADKFRLSKEEASWQGFRALALPRRPDLIDPPAWRALALEVGAKEAAALYQRAQRNGLAGYLAWCRRAPDCLEVQKDLILLGWDEEEAEGLWVLGLDDEPIWSQDHEDLRHVCRGAFLAYKRGAFWTGWLPHRGDIEAEAEKVEVLRRIGRAGELKGWALTWGVEPGEETTWSDLNWEALRRFPVEKAEQLLAARAFGRPGGEEFDLHRHLEKKWGWTSLPDRWLPAALMRGESPQELAPGLTRKEAHRWVQSGCYHSASEWLLGKELREKVFAVNGSVREVGVARWLLHIRQRGQWEALERERQFPIPGGGFARASFLSKVDEIFECDLDRGPATGIERAFESAARRKAEEYTAKAEKDQTVLQETPAEWPVMEGVRHLRTPAELAAEGAALDHCVGTYAPLVRENRAYILSLTAADGERTTVELNQRNGQWSVNQHYGAGNSTPGHESQQLLADWLASFQTETEGE